MTPRHVVQVTVDEPFWDSVSADAVRQVAGAVLVAEELPAAEVGVLITDDEMVRNLNRQYAGEDATTDVLAFSLREGEEFASPDGIVRLGEVIISYATAERQAQEAGRPVSGEMEHLLVHGLLHLLGYDHADAEEERQIRRREEELLGGLRENAPTGKRRASL